MMGGSAGFAARVAVVLRGSARTLLVVLVAVAGFQLLVGGGSGMGDVVRSMASALVGVLPLVFAGVCADLNQGLGSLWLQKPVSPVRLYLGRLAEFAVAAVALPLILVGGTALVLAIGGSDEASSLIRNLPALALWVTVVVSVGFGISAWLPRVGHVATVCVMVISFAVTLASFLAGVDGEPQAPSRAVFLRILPPVGVLYQLGDYAGGATAFPVGEVAWAAVYAGVWIGIGTLGVARAANGRLVGGEG